MSNVAVIDQREPRPNLTTGGKVRPIVPQSMDEVWRLASAVVKAGMAPKGLDTPEKATIAIMHGMEVGLTPLMALQRIAVVNGRPTIWGDGAVGLVRGSGLCEYIEETASGAGDARVATCTTKRKGEPRPVARSFGVADAKRAGLWNKQGPWQQFPDRMLAMRARAFCLRDVYGDVLGGLYLKEELDDAGDARAPVASLPVPPPPPPAPSPTLTALRASVAQESADIAGLDWDAINARLRSCTGPLELNAAFDEIVSIFAPNEDETDELQRIVNECSGRFTQDSAEP